MRDEPLGIGVRSFLADCETFADLPGGLLDELVSRMEQRAYEPEETLIRQGEAGDSLMVLLSGTAVAALRRLDGSQEPIADFHPGEVVGEMALLTKEPRTADVLARDEVHVLRLAARDFEELAHLHPQLGMVVTSLVAKRLGESAVDGLGGKRVDGYRIVRPVGRGAMAVVYEAESDSRGRVALKMMNHRLHYDRRALARFEREAAMLGGLDHENLAAVYQVFSAYRTRFISMEFCDGVDLSDRGRFPEESAKRILGQLAGALHYIHGMGVVHRDLKPSNVMVTGGGVVKLTDFGLAKPVEQVLGTGITQDRCLVGTPTYMAPEQLAGNDYDLRADYYALGCVALELLTGRVPFDSANFLALLTAKLTFELPPAEEIGDGVSPEMHAFLATALSLDPSDRELDLREVNGWAGPADPVATR
jgi:tRNA A-37 threonylcarbamoyl transferase component Bud32